MHDTDDKAFLGLGWSFPPVFLKGLDSVVMRRGVDNINENLRSLLATTIGERPFKTDFGTQLFHHVFGNPDARMQSRVVESVKKAIRLYEPRIIVNGIELDLTEKSIGKINIHVEYTVRQVNTRHNFVYPYYINEGTSLEF